MVKRRNHETTRRGRSSWERLTNARLDRQARISCDPVDGVPDHWL
jgi:hypothetical protein